MSEEYLEMAKVLGTNLGVLSITSFGSIELILKIILLGLTCVWTIIKIRNLLKK